MGVVSFADPVRRRTVDGDLVAPGHVGWIYQAMAGSLYTGRGTARTLMLLPDGRILHPRALQKIRRQERGHEYAERQLIALGAPPVRAGQRPEEWLERALAEVGVRRLRHRGCHRYVFRLGRNRRERERVGVRVPALPYPKQADPEDASWRRR